MYVFIIFFSFSSFYVENRKIGKGFLSWIRQDLCLFFFGELCCCILKALCIYFLVVLLLYDFFTWKKHETIEFALRRTWNMFISDCSPSCGKVKMELNISFFRNSLDILSRYFMLQSFRITTLIFDISWMLANPSKTKNPVELGENLGVIWKSLPFSFFFF